MTDCAAVRTVRLWRERNRWGLGGLSGCDGATRLTESERRKSSEQKQCAREEGLPSTHRLLVTRIISVAKWFGAGRSEVHRDSPSIDDQLSSNVGEMKSGTNTGLIRNDPKTRTELSLVQRSPTLP